MDVCGITYKDEFRITPKDIKDSVEFLKEGRMFINSLPGGNIPCNDTGGLGLFYADTRFLSCLELTLNNMEPVFLSRTLRDSHFSQVELTNKEFVSNGQKVPLQTVHIRLLRMIKDAFYQRIRIINFNQCDLQLNLRLKLGADFADIFEVRGNKRLSRGTREKTTINRQKVALNYLGKDDIRRSTEVIFCPEPTSIFDEGPYIYAEYNLKLIPKKKYYIYLKIVPLIDSKKSEITLEQNDLGFSVAARYLIKSYQSWKDQCMQISSDNERFNYMARSSITDLRALTTSYPGTGTVIEAGIPWYAAPFGRDALITAWQTLLVNPALAKDTLRFMARFQGREVNPWKDEEPGKILHELRFGEMARAGEIPHTPYYGSVDSTLWFIILINDYFRWTGDYCFLQEILSSLNKALEWCENYGDSDKDGYIEYYCQSEKGLANQGWKDSWNGVIDSEGKIPNGPIALVEVQGYYYKALKDSSEIFLYLGQESKAKMLKQKAKRLQKNFLKDFWLDSKGFLAYALDGHKKAVETIVSNPGHCLFTGILPKQIARKVIKRLMEPDLFSGWGIRTMSSTEVAYNPMSYHNGSVWPHDNAIIGFGIREAGEMVPLQNLMETIFQAAEFFDYMRLPELFCGFTRRGGAGPVKYPIACNPQAWAVSSIFLFLRALLGIECRGNEIYIQSPRLPGFLRTLRLDNICVGNGKVSLEFARRQDKTYCGVIETKGDVKVIFE